MLTYYNQTLRLYIKHQDKYIHAEGQSGSNLKFWFLMSEFSAV